MTGCAYLSYDIRNRSTADKKAVLVFQEDASVCPGLKRAARNPVSGQERKHRT